MAGELQGFGKGTMVKRRGNCTCAGRSVLYWGHKVQVVSVGKQYAGERKGGGKEWMVYVGEGETEGEKGTGVQCRNACSAGGVKCR